MSNFGDDFLSIFKPFSTNMWNCNSVSFHDKSIKLAFFPRVFRVSLSYERVTSDVESLLIPYLGVPYPKPLVASAPIHKRPCCVRHNASSKTFYTSSLSSSITGSFVILSQLPSWQCLHALVHSSPCFLHAFCRYTLGYCNLPNSCNGSSASVHLNRNICLSSLEQVCPTFHPQSDGPISSLL